MSRATLKVAFEGPAIHNGTMDVRDLAPALLAIGHLCEQANRVLNKEEVKATVLVRSDFRKGSFEVNLDLVQSLYQQVQSLLSGQGATAAANLLAFLTAGTGGMVGLFKLIKALRGRRPTRLVILEDGNVQIEVGQDTLVAPKEVVELFRDLEVRKAAAQVVRPLESSGIEAIKFQADEGLPEIIDKDDALAFAAPEAVEEQILTEERRSAYSILSISFKDGNKWRLFDGQNPIFANIADDDFLKRVNNNEISFAKNDILVCKVLIEQWRTNDGLRTEYTVLKVIEHRSAARQLPLPFDPPPSETRKK